MLKQVTLTSTPSTVVTPGPQVRFIIVQNVGAGVAFLSFDGGAGYIATNGKTGTNPNTTTLGYQLAANASVTLTRDVGGNSLQLPIIGASAGTTLSVVTDDTNSF